MLSRSPFSSPSRFPMPPVPPVPRERSAARFRRRRRAALALRRRSTMSLPSGAWVQGSVSHRFSSLGFKRLCLMKKRNQKIQNEHKEKQFQNSAVFFLSFFLYMQVFLWGFMRLLSFYLLLTLPFSRFISLNICKSSKAS